MFVEIENFKSAIAVENILTPYKRGRLAQDKKSYLPKEPITPEVCWEILKSTNNPRNIRDMLQCITELPQAEQARFKDVILATFDKRQQPQDIVDIGRALSKSGHFALPFAKIVDRQKSYLIFSNRDKADILQLMTLEEMRKNPSISAYTGVRLSDKKAQLSGAIDLPKFLDLRKVEDATLYAVNLTGVETILFRKGGLLELNLVEDVPHSLDVSDCLEVNISNTDLKDCQPLVFSQGAKVGMNNVRHIPPQSSFYNGADVFIKDCHLEELDKLRFRPHAKVMLDTISDLPHSFDVSKCAILSFVKVNFSGLDALRFYKGAKVTFANVSEIPPHMHYENLAALRFFALDCSKCTDFNFQNIGELSLSTIFAFPEKMRVDKPQKLTVINTKLPQNAELDLEGTDLEFFRVFKFPAQFDVSKSPQVTLDECHLAQFDKLTFMEDASVTLRGSKNLPKQVNFQDCSFLSLEKCDLSPYDEIQFRNNATVVLDYARHLPKMMNFAGCDSVSFDHCDMKGVKTVFFWDEEQLMRFGFGKAVNWTGKVIFIGGRNQSHPYDISPHPPRSYSRSR